MSQLRALLSQKIHTQYYAYVWVSLRFQQKQNYRQTYFIQNLHNHDDGPKQEYLIQKNTQRDYIEYQYKHRNNLKNINQQSNKLFNIFNFKLKNSISNKNFESSKFQFLALDNLFCLVK
ncbi:hypothetical protein pb186bvf_002663 [Paramecium bursaria]